jgi:hypothetical protein
MKKTLGVITLMLVAATPLLAAQRGVAAELFTSTS